MQTRLCVADPVGSVFHQHFADPTITRLDGPCPGGIEGIGRPRVEPSFIPQVIDRMEAVRDADSIGAMRAISRILGRRVGGSTGTNIWAVANLLNEMRECGRSGSIVTLLCDGGDRYAQTYYDDAWLAARGLEWQAAEERILGLLR